VIGNNKKPPPKISLKKPLRAPGYSNSFIFRMVMQAKEMKNSIFRNQRKRYSKQPKIVRKI
jgi:hypothetical protein